MIIIDKFKKSDLKIDAMKHLKYTPYYNQLWNETHFWIK